MPADLTPIKLKIVVEMEIEASAEEYGHADPVLVECQALSDKGICAYLQHLDSAVEMGLTYKGLHITRLA